jgi:hypothetical protein
MTLLAASGPRVSARAPGAQSATTAVSNNDAPHNLMHAQAGRAKTHRMNASQGTGCARANGGSRNETTERNDRGRS